MPAAWLVDIRLAEEKASAGDLEGAIALSRAVIEEGFASGGTQYVWRPTIVLVEALLRGGTDTDLQDAQAAINRLTALPTEPGNVMHDLWLLRMRALLARTRGDEASYRDYRDRYCKMATDLGFEGHMKWAEEMP